LGIKGGALYVYGPTGSRVKKISVRDGSASGNMERRKIGEWDLTGYGGRVVSEGSYAVKGIVTTKDGKKRKVSVVLGVR
jgi:hypothetical protein